MVGSDDGYGCEEMVTMATSKMVVVALMGGDGYIYRMIRMTLTTRILMRVATRRQSYMTQT